MNLSLRFQNEQTSHDHLENLHIKILSDWTDCITTSTISEESPAWEFESSASEEEVEQENEDFATDHDAGYVIANWRKEISIDFNTESILDFNTSPGLYAFLIGYTKNGEKKVISLSYLDCSPLMMSPGAVSARSFKKHGVYFDFKAQCDNSLISIDVLMPFEPFVIEIDRIESFPLTEDAKLGNDVAYIYGDLNFGSISRKILAFPHLDLATINNDMFLKSTRNRHSETNVESMVGASVPVKYKSILLAGAADVLKFKESLTSATFTLQLHTDDLCSRAFGEKQMNMLGGEDGGGDVIQPVQSGSESAAPSPRGGSKKNLKKSTSKGQTPEQTPRHKKIIEESISSVTEIEKQMLKFVDISLSRSEQINPHGTVRFRAEHLLENATDKLAEFENTRSKKNLSDMNVVISEDLRINVKPAGPSRPERWHMPKEISLKSALAKSRSTKQDIPDDEHDRTISSSSRKSGSLRKNKKRINLYEMYKEFETVLMLSVELHRKYKHPEKEESVMQNSNSHETTAKSALDQKLSVTPFSRMVIIFRYDDNDTLRLVNDAIQAVNTRALPNIQGTLRSYSLSPKEVEDVNDAVIDLVCGFMILDDETRLVVLEGLGGIGQGMQHIFADIPRMKPNDNTLKILCNPEVLFPKRLYTEFGPDLKRVRPREKLRKLAKLPELYNRKQVDEECFDAIDKLMALRRAEELKPTKELDAFPSATAINMLELLYGDALSKEDLDGVVEETESGKGMNTATESECDGRSQAGGVSQSSISQPEFSRRAKMSRTAPTDCTNPEFDKMLRSRDPSKPRVDYLKENREIRMAQWANALQRMADRDAEDDAIVAKVLGLESGKGVKISVYSGQRENFTEKLVAAQRKHLSTIKNATFTHSQEFMSHSIQLVDEEVDKKAMEEEERRKWTTKRGFVYPPPKNRQQLLRHPKRPNEARIEDLKEPYESYDAHAPEKDPDLLRLERNFSVKNSTGELFGMLHPPEFKRPFELSHVGHEKRLPRGRIVGGFERNDNFWKSVHLHGEESAKVQREAEEKDIADWKAKVVVDHMDFKVGGYNVRDRPLQMDRTADILKGEPKDLSLVKLRSMKSHSGKDLSYKTSPLTLMGNEKYVPNAAENSLLRVEDKTQFVTTKQTGNATDFTRYIHHGTGKPSKQMTISRRKHPPVAPSDKKGPYWEPASEKK